MSGFNDHKIAFLGFGEAGMAFVQGWNVTPAMVICAYDIKTQHQDKAVRVSKFNDYADQAVVGCERLEEALHEADVVFSLVSADQASSVAELARDYINPDAFYFDCNSCAPGTKRKNADLIKDVGARYVDAAIMAPVYPKRHQTPISLSGEHAKAAKDVLDGLGMNISIVEGDVGAASSIKMIRSIMVKGLEALFAECVLSARTAGIEEVVLESLEKSYPGFDFKSKAAYMLERSMTHGVRRAAEMREVALSVEELGLDADMAHAIVEWQQRIGDLKIVSNEDENYQERADIVLDALKTNANKKDC